VELVLYENIFPGGVKEVKDGAIASSRLAPGSVTAAALHPGAVVGSLNAAGDGGVLPGASRLG
jgi:hypothetical protein